MYLVIESVYDGTWASGPVPDEIVIADVLLETHWSWEQWLATPAWIRQTITDTIRCRREANQREHGRQESAARAQVAAVRGR